MTDPTAKGYTASRGDDELFDICDECGHTLNCHNDELEICVALGFKGFENEPVCICPGYKSKRKLLAKSAPDSEDEAFERAVNDFRRSGDQTVSELSAFYKGYARARLDAERGR